MAIRTRRAPAPSRLTSLPAAGAAARAAARPKRAAARLGLPFYKRLWRTVIQVKFGAVLIALIAVCVLIGTLVPQAPQQGVTESAELYQNFLAIQKGKFGPFVPFMDFLGLFDIFGAVYFRALLVLLIISISGSTLGRWPAISGAVFRPRIKLAPRAFDANPEARHLEIALPPAKLQAQLDALLAGHRLRRAAVADGDATVIYADRNRYAPLGTFLSHAGLILVLVGGLVRSFFGFHMDGFAIPDGSTRSLGFGTAISVENKGFVEIDDPRTGMPLDFYSDLVLYDNGVEKVRQRVRVNEPLSYVGIDFHQAYFGQAAVVRAADAAGKELFADGVPLAFKNEVRYGTRPFGFFTLLDHRLLIDIVGGVPGDPEVAPGEVVALAYLPRTGEPALARKLRLGQAEFFGQYARVRIVDINGKQLFNDYVFLVQQNEGRHGARPFGSISLLNGQLMVDLVAGTAGDPELAPGELAAQFYRPGDAQPFDTRKLAPGAAASVGGLQISLAESNALLLTFERERMFTGLQVEKNPGVPIIIFAAVLMLGGWGAVFYFPHRRLWALIRPDGAGGSKLSLMTLGKRDPGSRRFFEGVWKKIERLTNAE